MSKRALFSSFVVLAAGLLCVSASADAKGLPTFSALPELKVPAMLHPRESPTTVPETEKVDGITVQKDVFGGGHPSLFVVGMEGRCVTLGAPPPGLPPSGADKAMSRAGSSPMPLRIERITTTAKGEPALEIVDAWVDGRTAGAREMARSVLKLSVLGHGPLGYEIYGFRDGETMQVVLPAKERVTYIDASGVIGIPPCGHVRLTMNAMAKGGAMIVAISQVGVPSANRAAVEVHNADSTVRAQVARRPAVQIPNRPVVQVAPPPAPIRFRPFRISISASRMSRDKEPLLSVTSTFLDEPDGIGPSFVPVNIPDDPRMPEILD